MPDVPLPELRRRWEDARRRGVEPSAEQLCYDCPHQADQVRELLGVWAAPAASEAGSWGLALDGSRAQAAPTSGPAPNGPPPLAVSLQPGAEPVPGYRLVGFLGKGSFGEVWKATGPGDVETFRHEHGGKGGGPIPFVNAKDLTDEQLAAVIAGGSGAGAAGAAAGPGGA
jgi:hypothetical protein